MASWLACLSCECNHLRDSVTAAQEAADAVALPEHVYNDERIKTLGKAYLDLQDVQEDFAGPLPENFSSGDSVQVQDFASGGSSITSEEESEIDSETESDSSASSAESGIAPREPKRRSRNKLSTARFIEQGIGKFRSKMLTSTGPGALEHDRGVFIQEVYDFYDPSSGKVRSRKMTDKVIHRRRGKKDDLAFGATLSMRSTMSTSSVDSESEVSSCASDKSDKSGSSAVSSATSAAKGFKSGSESSPGSNRTPVGFSKQVSRNNTQSFQKTPSLQRKLTKSNLEVVATWGALVGNILHKLVFDFAALTNMMLREKRYLAAAEIRHVNSGIKSSVQEKASFVVTQALKLAKRLKREGRELLDGEWKDDSLLAFLFSTQYVDLLILFARAAAKMLHKQPTIAVALAPCHVFGDIHGQLRDLLLLFACFGMPSEKNSTTFVFNGDFVDRGAHQVEVIGLLLALKLCFPDRIWLVRGNHEDREMNKRYGFKQACLSTLGKEFGPIVFERIHQAFDELPLACLIEKKLLCVHGGIGDGTWTLDTLRTVKRPLKEVSLTGTRTWLGDILWSDPIEDGQSADPDVFGVHESPRGKNGALFAWNVTKTFCARNGLSCIIRSHQSKEGSPGFDVMHEHLLVRVFSARDYENHGNDGAILKIEKQSEAGKELLVIKPQVLRSVTKTRDEASRRRNQKTDESWNASFDSIAAETVGARKKSKEILTPTKQFPKGVDLPLSNRRGKRLLSESAAKARRASTMELMGALAHLEKG